MDRSKEEIGLKVEIEDIGKLDPRSIQQITEFISHETAIFNQKYPKNLGKENVEYINELNHIFILGQAKLIITDALSEKVYDSFVEFAKIDGQIAGFSITTFDKENDIERVRTTFTGVGKEYTRKGIATQLIKRRHKLLRERGISEYEISLWEKSLAVYEKMQQRGELKISPIGLDKHDYLIKIPIRD